MQKILSLCYPTYNRGWCMKAQIERLKQCPEEILDKVEVLISDNCSTDDTQEIVETAISHGFQCRYIRNDRNLGMDGNFVNCFKNASGKYVWLLGDDDIIVISSLEKIVRKLSEDKEYGLLHIDIPVNKSAPDYIEYADDNQFCKHISYWFSLISSNIPQTRFVNDVDFEKYMGTWFTLIPLYLESLHRIKDNLVVNFCVFEVGKDAKRNGGYNFFQVFVANYLNIMQEYTQKGYISNSSFAYMKKHIFENYTIKFIDRLLIKRDKNNLKSDKGWSILWKYYKNEPYFYLIPFKLLYSNIAAQIKKTQIIYGFSGSSYVN